MILEFVIGAEQAALLVFVEYRIAPKSMFQYE
jgi:hypothetical protein